MAVFSEKKKKNNKKKQQQQRKIAQRASTPDPVGSTLELHQFAIG